MSTAFTQRLALVREFHELGRDTTPLRLPFNGTLSVDEARMLAQGAGTRGTDYADLLDDLEVGDA
jgi:hypothetical protein